MKPATTVNFDYDLWDVIEKERRQSTADESRSAVICRLLRESPTVQKRLKEPK